jgi:hypothetical protein
MLWRSRRRSLTLSRRALLQCAAASSLALHAAPAEPGEAAIEAEIRRRAKARRDDRYLVVDYYRIRRKLAYRIPVSSLSIPDMTVPTIPDYPWSIWLLWALEERMHALGWAAEWFRQPEFERAAAADLSALASWPRYCQFDRPDLSSAHAGRLLWAAYTTWQWPRSGLREQVRVACSRLVRELLPKVRAHFVELDSVSDILALPAPPAKLANIPVIGTIGAALAAHAAGDPALDSLNRSVAAAFGAILELRKQGFSEGVAYDGYVLDFLADWIGIAPARERETILRHPRFGDFLDESYMLAAPGAMLEVAELSDVEPREMRFHCTAQAKLAPYETNPVRSWYLSLWRPAEMPAAALGAIRNIRAAAAAEPSAVSALDAHYALVLRSGWGHDDLAVAVAASNSPMAHVQNDNGSVVIGTRGRWIIADPGYQQYMQDAERDFTLGLAAHNAPVIDGVAQDRKAPKLMLRENRHISIELAGCYPSNAGVESLVRHVWLKDRALVVLADVVRGPGIARLNYHWHGHPEAAWGTSGGWILLHLPQSDLWFTTPQASVSLADVTRHPGSRGQLTLGAAVTPAPVAVWWVFSISASPPAMELGAGGLSLSMEGASFHI